MSSGVTSSSWSLGASSVIWTQSAHRELRASATMAGFLLYGECSFS